MYIYIYIRNVYIYIHILYSVKAIWPLGDGVGETGELVEGVWVGETGKLVEGMAVGETGKLVEGIGAAAEVIGLEAEPIPGGPSSAPLGAAKLVGPISAPL